MLIANPIYDVVFKYLMANLEISRGIISTIIDEEIVTLDFKAQENIVKLGKADQTQQTELIYYHLDFIAKIKLKEGGYKNVLIELQKSNIPYDIQRFRRYLGDQYKKIDEVLLDKGESSTESLPIISIYFLGFSLSDTLPKVIKVGRQYIDVLKGKEITERNEFIERLTHDAYIIQIPGLHVDLKTPLEYVLSVFQQENFINKTRHLKSYDYKTTDKLMIKILRQLEKAAADEALHRQLELEEMALSEYESTFKELERKLAEKHKVLEEKDKALDEKDKALDEKDKALDEKDKALDEKDKYIRELLKKLEG